MDHESTDRREVTSRLGFFPFVRAGSARLERAGSLLAVSSGDLSLERAAAQLLVARGDVQIAQGGAQTLLTTGDVAIDGGGALVAAGSHVRVTGGFVGLAAGAKVELHDSKTLVGGVGALLVSLVLGFVLGAATRSRMSDL